MPTSIKPHDIEIYECSIIRNIVGSCFSQMTWEDEKYAAQQLYAQAMEMDEMFEGREG